MRIVSIHEHSVDLDLLPPDGNILDIGCRGFLFTNYFRHNGFKVIAVDIDELEEETYLRCAIAGRTGMVGIKRTNDPQATSITKGDDIDSFNLHDFTEASGIHQWDLIKMDIEGAEYEVIMSLYKPVAKQLSIEFHLHTGVYGVEQMAEMYDKLLSLGYEAVKHEMTSEHGAGLNFWNSLFILK